MRKVKEEKINGHAKARAILDGVRPELLLGVTITPALLELVRVITVPIVEALNDLAEQIENLTERVAQFDQTDEPTPADLAELVTTLGELELMKERDENGGVIH